VSASLSVVSGGAWAVVVEGVVSYGTLAAGGQSFGGGSFVVDLSGSAPDAFEPVFRLAITSGQDVRTPSSCR
jgi:hypothetical protein